MESPSACWVTCSRSRVFASSVPITRPRSASTSWSASDWAFRYVSRVSKALWSATSVSARDFYSPASVSAWRAFTASSPRSVAVARSAMSCSIAHVSITFTARP